MLDQLGLYILQGLIVFSVIFIVFLLPLGESMFTKK